MIWSNEMSGRKELVFTGKKSYNSHHGWEFTFEHKTANGKTEIIDFAPSENMFQIGDKLIYEWVGDASYGDNLGFINNVLWFTETGGAKREYLFNTRAEYERRAKERK